MDVPIVTILSESHFMTYMYMYVLLKQNRCIDPFCSDEGLTLETSANTLFTAFSVSTSTLRRYIVRFTAAPTQTKTNCSHRDQYSIVYWSFTL